MDARQLEYFVAIVEHGGFSRAAAALHVAQPSLSQAMANLEAELGVALFHRLGRGVVLSEAGAELIEPSRRVLRDMAAVRDTATALSGLRRGTVEVATMPSPGIEPLTTLIRRFAELHPAVTVSTRAAFTPDEVVSLVRGGACELGLLGSARPFAASGVDVLAIEAQPFVVVAAPGGPVEDGVTIRPDDLAGRKLIASRHGSLMRGIVDDITAGGTGAEIVTVVDHRTSILPLVMAGVGVAVLPASWARLARRCGAVVAPIDPTAHLHVAMINLGAHLTPAARSFLALTRSLAGHQQDQGTPAAVPPN
ncbi:LysR family transcriptional regulator [Streptomyces radicis]|uniref:LysR family transcriptional regulator n=1 Tax=Streptomyces radicis TaxID=1750517 RepID=A0A3A9WHJ9_9ACTN|nr:LysR family transcriptional regulator [Streptomyces radicis]RKN12435.1 LysR family transcriptional regulator [Streptomyces radicis]RKN27795.1 LysR family transcriptional regulator [Streptomyces radicis]